MGECNHLESILELLEYFWDKRKKETRVRVAFTFWPHKLSNGRVIMLETYHVREKREGLFGLFWGEIESWHEDSDGFLGI